MTQAVDTAIADAKGQKPTFEFAGKEWEIRRKPSSLMLAELARTEQSEDPAAMGILADFFEVILDDQYHDFRKLAYVAEDDVLNLIPGILEKTLGRPTE